ncbi:DUF2959 domain-containing protein [Vibrio viridaestus]|uniref:DUF2959 domain-containing protein n=1 Tax=Vibrio viridaestus TaxID=2487322 RepID=A0A3N9TD15_9VIBR|nr:DUF2959 domain-containing protein [Vibrio viridaestus]RQW61405.1 DUF2959 domain-containing protein [Vibrio viridaestus]
MRQLLICLSLVSIITGCQSAYYSAMEKVGYQKRDIMVDRVEDAQASQKKAQEEFKSAYEQLKTLSNYDGGELEQTYDRINSEYEKSSDAVEDVQNRIAAIEDVADALFDEWENELDEYTNQSLRRNSATKLKATRKSYSLMITAMKRAEKKMVPVLNALRDNTLYLKHNLNASAVTSLKGEFSNLQGDIQNAINQMNIAISESDKFIKQLD